MNTEWLRAVQAYRQGQGSWGLEDTFVARYLAGESTDEERKVVEQEMVSDPRLADCIAHLRKVTDGRN